MSVVPHEADAPTTVRNRCSRMLREAVIRRWVAAALFVGGWSLLWAHGLDLVRFVPDWFSVATLLAGVALIPGVTGE